VAARTRRYGHPDFAKFQRTAGNAVNRPVHELWSKTAGFRHAHCSVFPGQARHGDVSPHAVLLVCRVVTGETASVHHSSRSQHTLSARTATVPASNLQGIVHPHLGAHLAVYPKGRDDDSRHFGSALGADELSELAGG